MLARPERRGVCRAEHFILFLRRFVDYLRKRIATASVVQQGCAAFLEDVAAAVAIEGRTLRFCYERLGSLMRTLQIHNADDFLPIQLVADFGTLIGTYEKGFAIIIEPYDDRLPSVPDPVIQLACLDASIAMKPVFDKYQTVVITSGTLSPIELYPRILDFNPVSIASLNMTLTRECLCPVVLTRGADQMPVSTKFDMRRDEHVIRCAPSPPRSFSSCVRCLSLSQQLPPALCNCVGRMLIWQVLQELRADADRAGGGCAGRHRLLLRLVPLHGPDHHAVAQHERPLRHHAAQAHLHRNTGRSGDDARSGQLPARMRLRPRGCLLLRCAWQGCRGY